MKLYNAILALAAAAILAPAACMAEEQTPPPDGQPPHMRGPGGPRDILASSPELKKLIDSYKASPSDDLKSQIKAKIAELFDQRIKEAKERLEKMQANRDKEIDSFLERALKGDEGKEGKAKKPRKQE